ncbi:MAG: glycosyltransferase family 4 protein [Clostridiales bacterium]|jgi:glycosyltransferase involved in cell wall biosynthesis|nr:glycosyltransferase family 4 protein [Clostridiales bacterium]
MTEAPDNFARLSPFVEDMVMREKPTTILEISARDTGYGERFALCQQRLGISGGKIERLDLQLGDLDALGVYDFVFLPELEGMRGEEAREFLLKLQYHVTKQILAITPEYLPGQSATRREFHPLTFVGLDFSYWMFKSAEGNWQFYSFYKKHNLEAMPLDDMAGGEVETDRKMRIAFILPHRGVTGGLKAMLHQMRRLHQRGHTVKAYYSSDSCERVLPNWSELTDEDVSEQIVVPYSVKYLDAIKDVDVIFLCWMRLIPQFAGASVPVVLWEQGYEYLFGDYGELKDSSFGFRQEMVDLYRLPVHILAVSPVISEILLAKYNRKTQLFPPGVDTDFYYPWKKNDELPPVMIVGHPGLDFKGFDFAFKVLRNAWDKGARFIVWWAYQVEPERQETPFPINYYYMLTQTSMALLYRFAHVFMSTSLYEAFSLPPLEAMSAGTAVLATDNGGIRAYAVPGENCLLCEQGDIDGMTERLITLLAEPELRRKLAAAGRNTALAFSADRVTDGLEKTLSSIAFGGLSWN